MTEEKSKKQAERIEEQLASGKITLNMGRAEIGLMPIENGDIKFTKVQQNSKKHLN